MHPESTTRQWRVPVTLPLVKLAGAAFLVALGLLFAEGDPVRVALAGLGAAALALWAARDLLAPVRLAVDPAGLTVVTGFAGRRRLDWSVVESISVDDRPRFGLRNQFLEIDTGESLHLLSRHDLGADPAEVARLLQPLLPPFPAAGRSRDSGQDPTPR
ncbi:PH domain-containing protein [Micromonospora pallida]|uniref:PH domain-containing protein n=1 Tax=Micromonospora pallida TaxID=145854 RepID=A0A1C6TBK3_9ACTN|nr:PH domain-containing protein [Micromonospora pallida]SCL39158.1 PH domain-containing protein [Micromonospora pallida]